MAHTEVQTWRVLIADSIAQAGIDEFRRFKNIETIYADRFSPARLLREIPTAHGLVVRSTTRVTRELIEAAPDLKVIGRAGVGVDNVDVEAATRRGVVVMNTPGANAQAAAELAIGLMFTVARQIAIADSSVKNGEWDKSRFSGVELYGKTVGVIGLGHVGRLVAHRCHGIGMRTIAYDPYVVPDELSEVEVRLVALDELLGQADFISLHIPRDETTIGFITEREIAKMKDGVYVINCSRGGIINELDLLRALENKKIAGAGIDVLDVEPPIDVSLVRHPAVVATPHIGASTREAQMNVSIMIANQVGRYLTTGQAMHVANDVVLPR